MATGTIGSGAPRASRAAVCARCQEPRSGAIAVPHPRLEAYTCVRCDYINVVAGAPETLPLPASLAIAGAEGLRQQLAATPNADAAAALALFRSIVAALADAARRLVDQAPDYARLSVPRALWMAEAELAKHGGRPEGNDVLRTAYAKASTLLFALTSRHGPADFSAPERDPVTAEERAFQASFWPVVTDAAGAGTFLHQCLRGDTRFELRNGEFVVHMTDLGLDLAEMLLNRRAAGANDSYEEEHVRTLRRALQLWRAIDLKHLLQYVVGSAGKRPEGLVTAPKMAVAPVARITLDAFELTVDRLRSLDDAWFLELGPKRPAPAGDAELGLALVMRNWSAYIPVFSAVRDGAPVYVMGPYGVEIMLDNLMSSKNRLLQLLTETELPGTSAAVLESLRAIRVALNRHAETRAQRILLQEGWTVMLDEYWTHAGQTEEIDVLAARASPHGIDVLVGEVKDFDFTLHRISGPLGLDDRIRKAESQLLRKHDFVTRSIDGVLARLALPAAGRAVHVHLLLITSDAPPIGVFAAVAGADFAALARFSTLLSCDRDLASRIFGRATRTLQS